MLTDEERGQIKRLIKQAKYPVRQVTLCCQLYAAKWEDVLECLPEGFEWIRKYQGPTRGMKARNFTKGQKLDICRRYMAGESKQIQLEYGIPRETLRTYVVEWKKLLGHGDVSGGVVAPDHQPGCRPAACRCRQIPRFENRPAGGRVFPADTCRPGRESPGDRKEAMI